MANLFMIFLLKCFYLMLPAYFANMAPVIVKKINLFVLPIDFNTQMNNKPVLGKNKTFRGFIFGVIFSIIIVYVQFLLYNIDFFKNISFFNPAVIDVVVGVADVSFVAVFCGHTLGDGPLG